MLLNQRVAKFDPIDEYRAYIWSVISTEEYQKSFFKLAEGKTQQAKLASKELLGKLKKGKLVIDWRRKQQARADVLLTIETILDAKLPRSYTPELYEQKCVSVFQHIYDSYFGAGKSVYTPAA